MRGDFAKLEGDILEVDTKRRLISVAGVVTKKADGTEVLRPIHPSKVVIIKLKPDKERDKIIQRRSKVGKEGVKQTS